MRIDHDITAGSTHLCAAKTEEAGVRRDCARGGDELSAVSLA
jgi:hypothetical protein